MRIAIAESDPASADLLVFAAQRRSHQTVCVMNVARLFERLPFEPAAAVVSMGDLDDAAIEEIARLKRRFPALGLFVITEQRSTQRPIAALRAGAQDVITSPYNPFEVIVRAEAWVAARGQAAITQNGVRVGDLEVDLDAYVATKNGQPLAVTRLERRLLFCLAQHYPNVASIDRLLTFGWDSRDEPDAALLKTHISHIRKKLRDAGGDEFEIVSHQGVGYSMRGAVPRQAAS